MNKLMIKWVLLLVAVIFFTSFAAIKTVPKPEAVITVTDMNQDANPTLPIDTPTDLVYKVTNTIGDGNSTKGIKILTNNLASDKTTAAALFPRVNNIVAGGTSPACSETTPLADGASCYLTLKATILESDKQYLAFKDDYITVCFIEQSGPSQSVCASASNDKTYKIVDQPAVAGKIEFPGSNKVRLIAPPTNGKLHSRVGETGVFSIHNKSIFPVTLTYQILANSGWNAESLSIEPATGSSLIIPADGTGTYDLKVLKEPDPASIGITNQDIKLVGVEQGTTTDVTNTLFLKIDYIPGTAVNVSPVEVTGNMTLTSGSGDSETKVAIYTNDTSSKVELTDCAISQVNANEPTGLTLSPTSCSIKPGDVCKIEVTKTTGGTMTTGVSEIKCTIN